MRLTRAVWIKTIHGGAHALHCWCRVVSCRVVSCLVLSCLVLSCLVLSCLVLSCLVLSCLVAAFSLFVRTQGIGVLRSHLPTSLFEHLSMGQARNPPTLGTTLCLSRALLPTLAVQPPHVCHRQRDWAVSIGSHTQQNMDIFEAASTPRRTDPSV